MVTIFKHQSIYNLSTSIVRPAKCLLTITPCRVRCAQSASSLSQSCLTNPKTKKCYRSRCSWLSQSSSNHSCTDLNSTIPYRPNNTYTEVCRYSSSHSSIYSYCKVVEHENQNENFNLCLSQSEILKGHSHCNSSLYCGNNKSQHNTKYSIYQSQVSKKMPMFSPRILYHHVFVNNALSTCQSVNISRAFSSGDGSTFDGTSDNDKNAQNINGARSEKLPRRVVKRLEKQGITEAEFLSKLKNDTATSSSQGPDKFTGKKEDLEELLKNMTTEPKYFTEADSFPSDMKRYKNWEKMEGAKSIVPKINPSLTSVVLFPGQGSQFVGMGKKLLSFPGVKDLYDEASSILGYDLLNLCLRGPKSELDKTIHCQPAVIITSLAAIEKFREEHPQAVENCVAAAGFSVGEFAALVFSGVLSFPDAVKLVKVRAEAMQKASEIVGSGMLTVFLAHDSDLKLAIKTAKEYCEQRRGIADPVCIVANYLFPECKVIAGHEEAIEFISTNAKQFNILRTKRLSVSGAFHTKLMDTAVKPLQNALTGMKIGRPKLTVYSNVTNLPYHANTNFSHLLALQLIKPVRWEQIMHTIFSRTQGVEFPNTYEVGPGKQMGTLLRQVNMQAYKQYHNIEV